MALNPFFDHQLRWAELIASVVLDFNWLYCLRSDEKAGIGWKGRERFRRGDPKANPTLANIFWLTCFG